MYLYIIISLNAVRCPYGSVTVGVASSVANDLTMRYGVIMRMTSQ